MKKILKIIVYPAIILIILSSIVLFTNTDASSDPPNPNNLIVNVSGNGCGSVNIFAIGNNGGNPIYLNNMGNCQYGAYVNEDDYDIYVCDIDKHGTAEIMIKNPTDVNQVNLILISGQCPYGSN
jgi:hypothetical protein